MAVEWLNVIDIANPCSADWNAMKGDDQSRFCQQCSKSVYNLSAMTSLEAEELIRAKEGQACIRLYRRQDGTVINRDCPYGFRRMKKWAKRVAVAAMSFLMLGGIAWAAPQLVNQNDQGNIASTGLTGLWDRFWSFFEPEPEPDPMLFMGEMVCPAPLPSVAAPANAPVLNVVEGDAPPRPTVD